MEKTILREFLCNFEGEGADITVVIQNLHDLANHINKLDLLSVSVPTLINIHRAMKALEGLAETMK